jgi:hypothetical protein
VMGHRWGRVFVRSVFLSALIFLITVWGEERMAVALLLKAGKEVPEGRRLVHISN